MSGAMPSTLDDHRPAAVICRERGWGPGTQLVGDEGYGPTVIEITAIGQSAILARPLSHNAKPSDRRETTWVLSCRDWQEAPR